MLGGLIVFIVVVIFLWLAASGIGGVLGAIAGMATPIEKIRAERDANSGRR